MNHRASHQSLLHGTSVLQAFQSMLNAEDQRSRAVAQRIIVVPLQSLSGSHCCESGRTLPHGSLSRQCWRASVSLYPRRPNTKPSTPVGGGWGSCVRQAAGDPAKGEALRDESDPILDGRRGGASTGAVVRATATAVTPTLITPLTAPRIALRAPNGPVLRSDYPRVYPVVVATRVPRSGVGPTREGFAGAQNRAPGEWCFARVDGGVGCVTGVGSVRTHCFPDRSSGELSCGLSIRSCGSSPIVSQ